MIVVYHDNFKKQISESNYEELFTKEIIFSIFPYNGEHVVVSFGMASKYDQDKALYELDCEDIFYKATSPLRPIFQYKLYKEYLAEKMAPLKTLSLSSGLETVEKNCSGIYSFKCHFDEHQELTNKLRKALSVFGREVAYDNYK